MPIPLLDMGAGAGPLAGLTVTPAQPEELPLVMALLDEAARWLAARDIQQWASPPPPELWARMAGEVASGRLWLAWLPGDARPVATLRLAWTDTGLWPDDDGNAAYVYSLALRSDRHGHGLGAALVGWAKAKAQSEGRTRLRLDCMADNAFLHRYYQRLGFHFCGTATEPGYTLALYETGLEG